MITRKVLLTIFTLAVIALPSRILPGQVIIPDPDTITLTLEGWKWGTIDWQKSMNGSSWFDIKNEHGTTLKTYADTRSWFRARITEGTCTPVLSTGISVEIRPFLCGDTVYDQRDGQLYPTVMIGSQCWMTKNMNIGAMVNSTVGQTDNGAIEKFCYGGIAANCEQYGGLYQWNEAMQYSTTEGARGICPEGWHIPSDAEWITLEESMGMSHATAAQENRWRGTDQGTRLKAGGSSGYNALLSGRSATNGMTYDLLNQYEFMYSSTQYLTNAWRRCLRTGDPTVGRWNTFPKSYAMSVRCMKNQ